VDKDKPLLIKKAIFLVLSGPSGTGKTTLRKILLKNFENVLFCVSATTRKIRPHEVNGKDYLFLNKETFEEMISRDEFVEYEKVHHNYYGTPRKQLQNALDNNILLIFDIDVYGGLKIKEQYNDALLIYIKVKDREVLKKRLISRGADDTAEIEKRLSRMSLEDKYSKDYDHIVFNDDLNNTIKEITEIILNH